MVRSTFMLISNPMFMGPHALQGVWPITAHEEWTIVRVMGQMQPIARLDLELLLDTDGPLQSKVPVPDV